MDKIKVTNELLKFVFGCECRFREIINVNTPNIPEYSIVYVKDINSATLGVYEKEYYINLDTFINIALFEWINDTDYLIDFNLINIEVRKRPIISMGGDEIIEPYWGLFSSPPTREDRILVILKALEYVCNQIGE